MTTRRATREAIAKRREQVRRLREAGLTCQQIAARLGYSPRVIELDVRVLHGRSVTCANCGTQTFNPKLGLCDQCRHDPAVLERLGVRPRAKAGQFVQRILPRTPWEKPLCYWGCGREVERVPEVCPECLAQLNAARQGMPKDKRNS